MRKEYGRVISVLFAVSTTALAFCGELDFSTRMTILVGSAVIALILCMALLIRANTLPKLHLNTESGSIKIFFGDIFQQEDGMTVIPFNEYFDTDTKTGVISKGSLNGLLLKKHGKSEVDEAIRKDRSLRDKINREQVERIGGGKKTRYRLGSICKYQDYALVAFSKFDKRNRAYLSVDEYIACLMNFWDEIDSMYNGASINMPLMGGGITRIGKNKLNPQDNLFLLLWTLNLSGIKIRPGAEIRIVLSEEMKDEINLFKLKGDLYGLQK